MRSVVLAVILLAVPALAAELPEEGHDASGIAQVVDGHCDEAGAVDGLMLNVSKPGAVVIRWNNESVCAKQRRGQPQHGKPLPRGTESL